MAAKEEEAPMEAAVAEELVRATALEMLADGLVLLETLVEADVPTTLLPSNLVEGGK